MKAVDRAIIAVQRRVRRRRRERELADVALPGLEGYVPPGAAPEAHVGARRGAGGKLARARSLRVAVAAAVMAAATSVPAYAVGGSIASAAVSKEANEQAYEEALADHHAAQSREHAALQAAVAAYSAEREAEGEILPEEAAIQRLQAEHNLSYMEAADAAESGPASTLTGQTPITAEAERMWETEPPETEEVRERIQAYEAASKEAEAAETAYEAELDRAID